jgi:C-terminal processing protease CtpA/Prc
MLPVWDFRTPGGVRVEGRGVEPNVPVRKSSGDMAAALRLLRGR